MSVAHYDRFVHIVKSGNLLYSKVTAGGLGGVGNNNNSVHREKV